MKISKKDIYYKGKELRNSLLREYRDRYLDWGLRILIFSPDNGAWFYGFTLWKKALEHMGIKTDIIYPGSIDRLANIPRYDIFIGIADSQYMDQGFVKIPYKIGIVSKQNDFITDSRLTGRDRRNMEIISSDFTFNQLISPFSKTMVLRCLGEWINAGFSIGTVPLSFDPITFYPVITEEIYDYFFVGTNSRFKSDETCAYVGRIFQNKKYDGIYRGKGWEEGINELPPEASRLFYSQAKINLNYHMCMQKDFEIEVNERTHTISACGGFQLVDDPVVLAETYSEDEVAVAKDSDDYVAQFDYYLRQPDKRHEMGFNALLRAYKDRHDLFNILDPMIEKYLNVGI